MTAAWETFDECKRKDNRVTKPEYGEGDFVWFVTKSWGRLAAQVAHVYDREGTGVNASYTIKIDAKDRIDPQFQPDGITFARGYQLLRRRRPAASAPPAAKKAAKRVTARVIEKKKPAVGRAKVKNDPLAVEFKSAE